MLLCSQLAYNELEDVLRPYSSLSYAWDEPSLPHRLLISQPGNRKLGVFNLDKVVPIANTALTYLCQAHMLVSLSSIILWMR